MKKATFLLMLFCILCTASYAITIYQNDYEGETVGVGAPGWHWSDNGGTHAATYQNYDGNIVIEHSGGNNNTTAEARNARFGSKWDITVTENTSADPADYTISFDVRLISASANSTWDPYSLQLSVVTSNPAAGADQYGHGFPVVSIGTADGWVHVEFNLADYTGDWWQGAAWDLTQSAWSIEVGPPWPGVSVPAGENWTAVWLFDNLKIIMGADTEAHDPVVLPLNEDGSSGTLISQTQAQVTLNFKAGGDPNALREPPYPMNPDILGHYIYLTKGTDDPNLYLYDYVPHVHNADPYLTDPNVWYGPIALLQGAKYHWQVEEALDDGTGNPYGPKDPNNLMGSIWTFNTIGVTPQILVGPEHTLTDFDGKASFRVTASPSATDYRWFKVGDPDVQLSDGGIYSGTQTTTLIIDGATVADEGEYYCIAYNGDPDDGGVPSEPSHAAKLWYPRLVSYYPFEEISEDGTSPDVISGFDAVMMQAGAAPLPGLNSTNAIVGSSCLQLDNANEASEDGQYAQLPAGVVDYKDITISLWIYPTSSKGWSRAIDFGNGTTDYLIITPEAGSGWGACRYATRVDDGTEQELNTEGLAPRSVVSLGGHNYR